MNVKEKVALLGLRPASATRREPHDRPGSAFHAPVGPAPSTTSATISSSTKAERQAAALQLWNRWAQEALGPMSVEPTVEELSRKSSRVQRLEHECAALAARAQRRLEVSSAIRSQSIILGGGSVSAGGGVGVGGSSGGGGRGTVAEGSPGSAVGSVVGVGVVASEGGGGGSSISGGVLLRPGAFNREMQFAVHERRREAAYAAVRAEGAAESVADTAAAADAASSGVSPVSFKSRAMLNALIASRGAGMAVGPAAEAPSVAPTCSNAMGPSPRLRPHSALPLRTSTSGSAVNGRSRPRSAVAVAAGSPRSPGHMARQASIAPSSVGSRAGGFGRSMSMAQRATSLVAGGFAASATTSTGSATAQSLVSVPEGEYLALRQEVESVSQRVAAAQAALEVQADTEAQLRAAVDLLRARLHSSGLREVDAQRRLAQHSRLEPLFDRLAECFTFSSPEEVVARLEFLEDDKLGTFDQLLRTQEEVTRLQQRMAEAQKAGDMTATRLTTEHLQGSARLQEQNEELRQELESMENLVHRLTSRQAQLVALQTAVLQLWGKLSEDSQFSEAFVTGSSPGGAGGGKAGAARRAGSRGGRSVSGAQPATGAVDDAAGGSGGGNSLEPDDPLSMLHMIEEFVTAKSNKLAIRHFADIQRIANHVWQQHFRSRADIRGRVVPTFEQLSTMADRMAGRVKSVEDQAGRSEDAEKTLIKEVKRLQKQKRVLETALARRDEQLKTIMGVPRRERPVSATAEVGRILRREAMTATSSTAAGATTALPQAGASRAMSVVSLSPSGLGRGRSRGELPLDASLSVTSGLSMMQLRQPQLKPHGSHLSLQHQHQQRMRPASAPNSTTSGGGVMTASRLGPIFSNSTTVAGMWATASPMVGATAPLPTVPSIPGAASVSGTLAAILSPAITSQVPQMVRDLPMGAHWRQLVASTSAAASVQRTAPTRMPAGSLYYTADRHPISATTTAVGGPGLAAPDVTGGVAASGEAADAHAAGAVDVMAVAAEPPTVRWSAPQRSAIEHAFLTRLERRTRVT